MERVDGRDEGKLLDERAVAQLAVGHTISIGLCVSLVEGAVMDG